METFVANIYMGLRAGYSNTIAHPQLAETWLQDIANNGGLCVSVTPTTFIYKDGREPGIIIGLINYPRFPATKESIKEKAIFIATNLGKLLGQNRVSIVCTDETILVELSERI